MRNTDDEPADQRAAPRTGTGVDPITDSSETHGSEGGSAERESSDADGVEKLSASGSREESAQTPEELLSVWEDESPQAAGGLSNLIACSVTLVFGIVGMVLSWALSLGSLTAPAPGFFPFVISFVITVLSAAQMVLGRAGGDGEKFIPQSRAVFWGVLTLIAFVAVLPLIGFELPALLLAVVWMRFLGGERWRSAVLYSALTVIAFYLIFVIGLRTQLPHLF